MQAHSREYHGPINTEQVMLIRCAVGHIPSIRKMGEITTPIATIIARNTMRNVFILCFSILHSSCFSGFLPPELRNEFPEKKRQLSLFRSKFHYFLSLRKHGFPSLCKLLLPDHRALPLQSSLPARNRCTDIFHCAVRFCVLSIFCHSKECIIKKVHPPANARRCTSILVASLRWHDPNQVRSKIYLPLSLSHRLPRFYCFYIVGKHSTDPVFCQQLTLRQLLSAADLLTARAAFGFL